MSTTSFAEIAALAGDPARAAMLHALMDGRALTASELAGVAGITAQTASGHLSRMVTAGLISVEQQGRHRYHRLATTSVAAMLEGIMQVAAELQPPRRRLHTGPRDASLRQARTCYDHFAGRLGVALADGLIALGHIELTSEAGVVTDTGHRFFAELGLALSQPTKSGRMLCRPCLDWSERRPHLAGVLGASLCRHSFAQGWVRRYDGPIGDTATVARRAVFITPVGRRMFREQFRAVLDDGGLDEGTG
jgi:DNA-binding transcriptional ArsR family regulator